MVLFYILFSKNLISVLVPSPINIVALQQVVETTNVAPQVSANPGATGQHPPATAPTSQTHSNVTQQPNHHSPSIPQSNPNINQIPSGHHHQQHHMIHHQQQQINGPVPHAQNQTMIAQQHQMPAAHPQQQPQLHPGHVNSPQIGPAGVHSHQNVNPSMVPNQQGQHLHQQQPQPPHLSTQPQQPNQPNQSDYSFQGNHLPYQNAYQQQQPQQQLPPAGTGAPSEMMLQQQQQHQQNMYASQQNMYANQPPQYMNQQAYGMQQQRGMPNANYGANPGNKIEI